MDRTSSLESMPRRISCPRVQCKRTVSTPRIDRHNAIHLSRLSSSCHARRMFTLSGKRRDRISQLLPFARRYKTTAAGKNLEHILQKAIQHATLPQQAIPSATMTKSSVISTLIPNGKRTEPPTSLRPTAKRTVCSARPLNLSMTSSIEEDSGTASSSPTSSLSHDVFSSLAPTSDPSDSHTPTALWDESVTDILLAVANQRETRTAKINTLRGYLEEKLGFMEFLCLYRGFKSEPKLTFHRTPWEHYQRFLPVLFTLLTLDNTTV